VNTQASPHRDVLPVLTTLRFFAAFSILLFHLKFFMAPFFHGAIFDPLKLGVEFFFILSGFILAFNYASPKPLSVKTFYIKRFSRIYPVHILTFAVWFSLYFPSWTAPAFDKIATIAANLTLSHALIPGMAYSLSCNPVSWSLSDEACFYVFFPWLRRLWQIGVIFTLPVIYLVGTHFMHWEGSINHWFPDFNYFSPIVRVCDFAAGMLAARTFSTKRRLPCATALELAVVLILGCQLRWIEASPDLMQLWFLVPLTALIWVFAHQEGIISRFLSRQKALILLGEASFSLYMWHVMILAWCGSHFSPHLPAWLALGAGISLCIGVALGCFKWFESPLRRRIPLLLG
jgi:peptidoglycan/LPS O-acetylase OafA/YrhL